MKHTVRILLFLFSSKLLFAQSIDKSAWRYGEKGMLEISGNFSAWYERGNITKSVTALVYPELGYFFSQKWYASTSTALQYFYTEFDSNPNNTSNMNIQPNLGMGRVFDLSSWIFLNIHGSFGGEYTYCFYPHCKSRWYNGLRVSFDPSLKFLLKESVFLNVTWAFRGYFGFESGRFADYFSTAIILGFSYAF